MPSYNAKFGLKDKVIIDGQKELIATISALNFQHDGEIIFTQYQCEWIHNGANYQQYISGHRLMLADV